MRKALTLTLIATSFALITFVGAWWAVGQDMADDLCAAQAQQEVCE